MAAEPLPPPDLDEEEEGGGPVKPFLEHLEDLRWTIIKVLAAVFIAMLICLVAGNKLVAMLTWPLIRAQQLSSPTNTTATVRLGEASLGKLAFPSLPTNLWPAGVPKVLRIAPVMAGSNLVLALEPETSLSNPAADPDMVLLKNYSPIGGIMVALELALYGGLALASPFVMLFIGQFVLPALRIHEKKFLYRAVGVGVGLFLLGVAFCYFFIMQVTIVATVQFSEWLGFRADEWRAEDYIDFVVKMMLAVGLSFQLPVVILTLVRIGILDYRKLQDWRSYFIVLNMVVCAVVTPSGDPFTMLLLAVPVQILYEASVFIAWRWWKKDQRQLAAAEATVDTAGA